MTLTAEHNRGLDLARSGRLEEAEAVFRALLDTDPADTEALHFFAVLASQKQDLNEAERLLLRAIDARGDWAKAWNSLGRVYQSQGRLEDAAAAYEKAVGFGPAEINFRLDFGAALRDLGKLPEAATVLKAATEAAPDSADAFTHLGAVLKDMSLDEAAEATCRQAIAVDRGNAEAHNILGIVLRRQGRYADAETAYRQAVALNPGFGLYNCNLANLLRDTGRLAEAEEEYRRAIDQSPSYTETYRQLADLTRISADDPVFSRMETLLATEGMPAPHRMELHFAFARTLENQGRFDDAFHHWEEANRLKRSRFDYDDAEREDRVGQIMETFNAALMKSFAGQGDPSDAPIFIVGMPRSGTTLVEQILASHSAVEAMGELAVLGRLAGTAGYPEAFRSLDAAALRKLGEDYLAQAQPAGSRRFTDKMPGNFMRLGLIRLILPNARIVHCTRDPVDTCLSCFRQHFSGNAQPWAYDLQELGREYRRYARLMDHWRSVAPDAMHEVRYEALLDDQEGEIRRLLDYCGLPFEETCLRFHESDRPVTTASASQVRRPVYRDAQGRWKNYEAHLTPLLTLLQQ